MAPAAPDHFGFNISTDAACRIYRQLTAGVNGRQDPFPFAVALICLFNIKAFRGADGLLEGRILYCGEINFPVGAGQRRIFFPASILLASYELSSRLSGLRLPPAVNSVTRLVVVCFVC
jgi:hypothetical protein